MTYPSVESFCIYSCYIGDLAWTIQPFVSTGKCNLGAFNIFVILLSSIFDSWPSDLINPLVSNSFLPFKKSKGHCGCDHTLFGFTTTNAISTYQH